MTRVSLSLPPSIHSFLLTSLSVHVRVPAFVCVRARVCTCACVCLCVCEYREDIQ